MWRGGSPHRSHHRGARTESSSGSPGAHVGQAAVAPSVPAGAAAASGLSSRQKPASRLSRILVVIFFGGEKGRRKGQISSKPGCILPAVGGGLVDGRPAGPPLPLPTPDRFIPRNVPEDFYMGTYIFLKCKKVLGVDYDNCFSTFLLQIICGVFASARPESGSHVSLSPEVPRLPWLWAAGVCSVRLELNA